MQRLFHRIDDLEARIPAPPERIDWYKLLEESGFYGQQRADFEVFLRTISDRDLQDLTDQELFTLETWTHQMNEQVQAAPIPARRMMKHDRR